MIQLNLPLFFLVRHGETASNDLNIYRGWSNGPKAQLSQQGKDDIREAGIYLQNVDWEYPIIIADDLDRTQESAKILQSILGIEDIETVPALRPLNVGDFTQKSKEKYPLEEYLKDKNRVIPGGESVNQFSKRQAKFFAELLDKIADVQKLNPKATPVLVGHGSNVSFLNNHMSKTSKEVGYEGLTKPGGVLVFSSEGIAPLTKKKGSFHSPYADGTALSGFVTDEENRPPRECWNCRNFVRDVIGLGACTHTLVRIDPELKDQRQDDLTVAVKDRDCCNNFRNKINT